MIKPTALFLLIFLVEVSRQNAEARDKLYIGGLVGIDTSAGGWNSAGTVPALRMAFEDINNHTDILRDYQLELLLSDSKCNLGEAVRGMMQYISQGPPKIMFLGPGCSKAAMPVAESVHYWNVVQIGFSNSSPLLSAKRQYPLYFRTNPSEKFSNLGRVAILKRFKWKRVAILQQNNDVFTGISNSLVTSLKQNNISVITYESYKDTPKFAIENLKKKDARIIFAFFYFMEHYVVFCEAVKQGMFGPKFVWILISGRNEDNWWRVQSSDVDCSPAIIRQGLGNNIGTGEMKLSPYPGPTITGETPSSFYSRYLARANHSIYGINPFAAFAYDAAWTCALTLNSSIKTLQAMNMTLKDFNYSNPVIKNVFVDILKNTSFTGMTGQIRFDENFDRITKLEVRQIQGDTERVVGLYDMATDTFIDNSNTTYVWEGGKVPVDGLTVTRKQMEIEVWVFWIVTGISLAGIAMSIGFLFFNIYNRDVRYIKMSSPHMNNLMIVGCVLVYVGGILSGYGGDALSTVCQAETWIITVGFTMAFGAIFSKTWRVHVIFLNSNKTTKRVIIRDRQLFFMVGIFLVIDLVILLTWQLVDPPMAVDIDMPQEISEEDDTAISPFTRHCRSKNMEIWKGIMYGYKGLLLLFGSYLAWETRKVHISALNDSKLIGMSVYNVVIPCALIIPIQTVITTSITAYYGLTVFLTIFCTTFTLCIVFIPKILFLKHNDGNDIQTCAGNSVGVATEVKRQMTLQEGSSSKRTDPEEIEA